LIFVQSTPAQTAAGSTRYRSIANPLHTVLLLAVQAFFAYRGATHAAELRSGISGSRMQLYEQTMLVEWLTLGLVILGVWVHRAPLSSVLGARWKSVGSFLLDLGVGAAFLMVAVIVQSALGAHSANGPDQATQFLLPRGARETTTWLALSLTAGICEEGIFRGYFQQQFTALTRNVPAGVLLQALLFGASHLYQGAGHAAQIALLGAASGLLVYWRKSVRPAMMAHALQDSLAVFVPRG